MISEKEIISIVNAKLEETSNFVVDVKVLTGNRIFVFIDGDEGVSIDDCIKLSKHIESSLNRDVEDFSLDVSSAGLTSPLKILRQYKRFLGKPIEIITSDGQKQKGVLVEYSEENIKIKAISDRKKSAKVKQEENSIVIPFKVIKEVKPVITFK
jgi:ribosome maturation factor RimP